MSRWIYGKHAVMERLRQGGEGLEYLVLSKGLREGKEFEAAAKAAKLRVEWRERAWLDERCEGGAHQGVAAAARNFEYADLGQILKEAGPDSLLLALDGIEDPHNLGAILRTAECAGVLGVVIPRDRAVQVTPTVEKASSGAAALVPLASVTNLSRALEDVKAAGFWIYGLTGGAEAPLYSEKLEGRICLALGAEGRGLRPLVARTCDKLLRIPLRGSIDSLNVSVAAGVALFEMLRQKQS